MRGIYVKTKTGELAIRGYSIRHEDHASVVRLSFRETAQEIPDGFEIYAGDELLFDGRDCIYRWDVLDHKPKDIYYTNDESCKQTKPFPVYSPDVTEEEPASPLTNEELIECVADLMYQMDKMKLGLEE